MRCIKAPHVYHLTDRGVSFHRLYLLPRQIDKGKWEEMVSEPALTVFLPGLPRVSRTAWNRVAD